MSSGERGAALSGVRVIDLTQFESGTSCTETLAWLGADVIKVEPPGRGEQGRRAGTDKPGDDAPYFLMLNANKRSITLDIRTERGRELLRRLIAVADVFVENFRPGLIERLGFGYEDVAALNPRIIYATIKGFDPDGPYADFLCFDAIAQSVGGAVSMTGEHGRRPMKAGPNLADTGTGLHCAIGILAALVQRNVTGTGQRVAVAMQEAVINFIRIGFSKQLTSGTPPMRSGSRSPLATAPADLYPCSPGGPSDYCMIYTTRAGNEHWHRILEVIGRPELRGDPRFDSPEARAANADDVDEVLSQWTQQFPKREVMERLGHAGVPAGAVFDTEELLDDPYLRENGTFVTVEHPQRGRYPIPGWPVRMSDSKVEVVSAPPLGAHTNEVLSGMLGLTDDEIETLRTEQVV